MLLRSCPTGFQGTIELAKDDEQVTLTITPDVLDRYFDCSVVEKYINNTDKLEEDVLLLENVDFTYNNIKLALVNIINHGKD